MLCKGFESPFISLHVVRKVQNGCSALLKHANIYENTLCETKMESGFGMATFYSSTQSSQSFSLGGGGLSSYNDVREVHDALLLIFYNL